MLRYAARRLPSALLVLLLASVAIFPILRLAPGDPAVVLAGPDPTPLVIESIRQELGLNEPLPIQYGRWIGGVLTGNLGRSYVLNAPISTLIVQRAGNTLELALAATLLALALGLALGTLGAVVRAKSIQTIFAIVTTFSLATPTFISGLVLVFVFAVMLRVLPPGGHVPLLPDPREGLRYLALPAVCLAVPLSAVITRFLRTALLQVIHEDYFRTAVAKGLRDRVVLSRHAMPNALPGVMTVVGIHVGQLLGGAVIVEAIFAWPGLGQLILRAVLDRDYLLVQDLLLLAVAVFVVIGTATDIARALVDPRIRVA